MSETPKTLVTNDLRPYLTVRVEPDDMVQYVHNLMTAPNGGAVPDASAAQAVRQWGDTPLARAAQLRWSALNRAIGDARVSTWTSPKRQDKVHVAAALIGAAAVARLKMAEDEVVFDIPTLLDVTLQLCEPVGHA